MKNLGIPTVGANQVPYCDICKRLGHLPATCWYNPEYRGPVPSHIVQNFQTPNPTINQIGVDQRGGPRNQRSNQNYRQNPNQWVQQDRNNSQGSNQNLNDNNISCYYCGKMGHRQGPACDLWCRHRTDRGMPVMQYNDRQEGTSNNQNTAPAQLNVVLLEELPPNTVKVNPSTSTAQTAHWNCDCADCIQVETAPEDTIIQSLAITRSKKSYSQPVDKDKENEHPIEWKAQKDIRTGVIKEIQNLQGLSIERPIIPISPS